MSANEFDELIRHKFDETDIAYNPGNWEKMSKKLSDVQPQHKNNILFLGWPALGGIAAAMALLISLPIVWLQNDKNDKNNKNTIAVTGERRKSIPSITTEQNTIPRNIADAAPRQSQLPPVQTRQRRADVAAVNPIITPKANEEVQPQVVVNSTADNHTETVIKQSPTISKQKVLLTDPVMDAPQTNTGRTTINLVGGFNYNSASAGYTIGASANRKLGEKLYVEGNLAYVNSSVGSNSIFGGNAFTDNYDAAPGAGLNGGKTQDVDKDPVQYSLSYLQFSPVMCYEVIDHLTLGAGPDLQQLLNTQTYYIQNLPSLDIGLLGKAELSITEKLKAGLQYRAGMNTAIHNKPYTERNYMQVQLRYSIFKK